jgi:hypothetical protein
MWWGCGGDVVEMWWRYGGDVVKIWCISIIESPQITIHITIHITISCVEIHYKYQPKKYHKFSMIFTMIMKKIFIVNYIIQNTTMIGGFSTTSTKRRNQPKQTADNKNVGGR